jgi:hypothetical protein
MRGLGIGWLGAGRCKATATKTQAGPMALSAAWRPVDRPEIPRGEGAHSRCSSRPVGSLSSGEGIASEFNGLGP